VDVYTSDDARSVSSHYKFRGVTSPVLCRQSQCRKRLPGSCQRLCHLLQSRIEQGLLGQDLGHPPCEPGPFKRPAVPVQRHFNQTLRPSVHLCLQLSVRIPTWPVPSRQPVSPLVARHPASSWPPRPQGRVHLPLEVSRR